MLMATLGGPAGPRRPADHHRRGERRRLRHGQGGPLPARHRALRAGGDAARDAAGLRHPRARTRRRSSPCPGTRSARWCPSRCSSGRCCARCTARSACTGTRSSARAARDWSSPAGKRQFVRAVLVRRPRRRRAGDAGRRPGLAPGGRPGAGELPGRRRRGGHRRCGRATCCAACCWTGGGDERRRPAGWPDPPGRAAARPGWSTSPASRSRPVRRSAVGTGALLGRGGHAAARGGRAEG